MDLIGCGLDWIGLDWIQIGFGLDLDWIILGFDWIGLNLIGFELDLDWIWFGFGLDLDWFGLGPCLGGPPGRTQTRRHMNIVPNSTPG